MQSTGRARRRQPYCSYCSEGERGVYAESMRLGDQGRRLGLVVGGFAAFNMGLWAALTVRHLAPASLDFFRMHLPGFWPLFVLWQLLLAALGLYDLRRLHDLPATLGILGI